MRNEDLDDRRGLRVRISGVLPAGYPVQASVPEVEARKEQAGRAPRAAERDVRRYFAVRAGRGAAVFHAEGRRYAAAHRLHRGADFRRDPVGELFFRHHLL